MSHGDGKTARDLNVQLIFFSSPSTLILKIFCSIFLDTIIIAVVPRGGAVTETTRCCQSELEFPSSVDIWLRWFRLYPTFANQELLCFAVQWYAEVSSWSNARLNSMFITQLEFTGSRLQEGVIMVSLYDDYLLRFELKFHPFTVGSFFKEFLRYWSFRWRAFLPRAIPSLRDSSESIIWPWWEHLLFPFMLRLKHERYRVIPHELFHFFNESIWNGDALKCFNG